MAASTKNFSQASRFAVLTVDDDVESDENVHPQKVSQDAQKSNAAKKRNRKKKKADQVEKAELRELAFGGSSTKAPKKQSNQAAKKAAPSGDSEEQWKEWRKVDEGFTNVKYETDLQKAILQSKLDYEKDEELKASGVITDNSSKDSKKKKKKKTAMSLDEFNHMAENNESDAHGNPPAAKSSTKLPSPDPDFFERVDKDASKTVMKEKIQEEYTKQYIVQNARSAHYEKQITMKDKEIIMLRATVTKLKEEALEAKQRNQQLCSILSQGEMKDKASVLESLEELTQVKNELTEQITELTAELEKEKSRSHGLETELKKYQAKGSKHK